MGTDVTTSTTELGNSRVRVQVEVRPEAVEREVEAAARALARDIKIPGFRKGKVPAEVVIRRFGREAVLDDAVRRGLPRWYEDAVGEADIAAVGDPKLDLRSLPEKGSPLEFSIEVGVRPPAQLGSYKGLEVGRREPEAPEDQVEAELARLRESVASLETVEREAAEGDFVVIDFLGKVDGEPFEGGEARGYLLELGSGRLLEGFEEQLVGAPAGAEREVTVTFPEDYRAEHLAGKEAVFTVTVKEVKEKNLPDLDDEFAAEAGGFDTLDELREDIRSKLREAHERAIEGEFREAVVDAAVAEADLDVPNELVHAKAHEMWEHTSRRLKQQGVDPARYLQLAGKTEEQLVEEAQPDAERALKRESVLAAIVEAEGIEVSDEEVLESLRAATSAPGEPPPPDDKLRSLLARAKADGRDELLREDIAMRKAVELLVEHATPISLEQATAREKLWTPEKKPAKASRKEPAGRKRRLWTPGS